MLASRRSFIKGIAALGGLVVAGPLCLLEERPKLFPPLPAPVTIILLSAPSYGRTYLSPVTEQEFIDVVGPYKVTFTLKGYFDGPGSYEAVVKDIVRRKSASPS